MLARHARIASLAAPIALGLITPAVSGQAPSEAVDGTTGAAPAADALARTAPTLRLPEGTFIRDVTGLFTRDEIGDWILVPDDPEVPVLQVLPSAKRYSMELVNQRSESDGRFLISGEVMLYNGRNYLLPISHRLAPKTALAVPIEAEPVATHDPRLSKAITETDRIASELARAARIRRSGGRMPSVPTARADGTEVRIDRSFVRAARGRMVRSGVGEWIFAQDNDGDGREQPPAVLQPCANLQAMEGVAERQGDSVTFTVSGERVNYQGKAYLIPRLYVVNRDVPDLSSAQ